MRANPFTIQPFARADTREGGGDVADIHRPFHPVKERMSPSERKPGVALAEAFACALLWLLWQAVRWPLLAALMVLEPVVRVLLCALALAGTLTALLIRFAVNRPQFPFWGTLGASLACMLLLVLWHAAIRIFSER